VREFIHRAETASGRTERASACHGDTTGFGHIAGRRHTVGRSAACSAG